MNDVLPMVGVHATTNDGELKMEGTKIIVRTYSAGVHYGTLVSRTGDEVVLKDSRRIWYWAGAASLSQLALEGVKRPAECKFAVILPLITILGAIELIPCSDAGINSIEAVPAWRC